jgi:two-component system OmpR family sensor kinase
MRRLHLQIFGALVLAGLTCVAVVGVVAALFADDTHTAPRFVRDVGALVVEGLPEDDPARFQRVLSRRAQRLHASISIWDEHGRLLGRAGRPLPRPQGLTPARDVMLHERGSLWLGLPDGRTLAVSFHGQRAWFRPHGAGFALAVLGLVLVLLVGSYLAARRITRRLELLEQGVTRFGEGDLSVRVREEGRDEVAQLARAFNRSFARISGLLRQQRRMLQSASHELRSPLARLRMAFELATEPDSSVEERTRLAAVAEREIAELDMLISDLLLAGRLTDAELPKEFVTVPLGTLLREEAARAGAELESDAPGQEPSVSGNARMLKSLVRNLFENAKRYGRDPVRASLGRRGAELLLWVDDQGAPVPEADRERIFEPFYRPEGHREGKDGGVGLGLHLVRSIAEHHGGSVRYLVHEGHSRFEVRLPLAGTAAAP